jgi:hypothetical protein
MGSTLDRPAQGGTPTPTELALRWDERFHITNNRFPRDNTLAN